MSTTTNATPATCPAWCVERDTNRHAIEAEGFGVSWHQHHMETLAEGQRLVVQVAAVEEFGRDVEPGVIFADLTDEGMTPDEARRVAVALMEAANVVAPIVVDAGDELRVNLPADWTEAEREQFTRDAIAYFDQATSAVLAGSR